MTYSPLHNIWLSINQRSIICLILVVLTVSFAKAQDIKVKYIGADSASDIYIEKSKPTSNFSDVVTAKQFAKNWLTSMHNEGYLAASLDTFSLDSNIITTYLYLGQQYQWAQLSYNKTAVNWLNESGINHHLINDKPIRPKAFQSIVNRLLTYGENHGFPFATVQLDSTELGADGGLKAQLVVYQNRYFEFDTISVIGDAPISKAFLYQYLGFSPKEAYNEKLVVKLREKIAKLPFTTITANPRISFAGQKVRITLYLKHRKTDQADGIVGFAPNTTGNSNNLLITGEVNLALQNMLRRGIGYDLHWKSFAARSQQLKMNGQIPYLFKNPIGLDGNFEYVKLDTQFFTLKTKLGVRYLFEGTDYLKIYVQNAQSALIFADTASVRISKTIPIRNPVRTTSYGLQILRSRLDNPLNPRKGFKLAMDGNIGTRNVMKDIRIDQVEFTNSNNDRYSVYDSIKLKSLQAEFTYDASFFVPIGKKSTAVGLISGKQLITESVFINDLYRYGGTKSLRGFNEESLLANSYTMVGLEYRYILGENAFFQLFVNAAYMEDKSNIQKGLVTDIPYGFGAGVHLDVNSGILSLAYALGSEQGNGIKLSQAKIHFGIINYL